MPCASHATTSYKNVLKFQNLMKLHVFNILSVVMTNARRAPAYIPRHAIRIPICPAFSCAMLVVRGFFSFVFGIPVQETKKSGFQILWCCYIWSPPQNLDLPGQVLRHLHRKLDVKHAIFTTCVSVYETLHSARSARGRAHQLNFFFRQSDSKHWYLSDPFVGLAAAKCVRCCSLARFAFFQIVIKSLFKQVRKTLQKRMA